MPLNLFNRKKIQPPTPSSSVPISGTVGERLKNGVFSGLRKGWDAFLWMMKILLPVSLAVALLQWSGWLYKLDFILNPVMNLLNLPSEATFPILSGLFINIYAAIAILTVVPFSLEQMTLIAVFTLVAHSIFVETIIQHKSGINGIKIALIRVIVAIVTVLLISLFLGDTSQSVAGAVKLTEQETILRALATWGKDTGWMLLKILCIIMSIMITLECLRWLEWDRYLYRFFRPFMKALGLSDRTVILWVTAVLFGLMYGSAVILEKSKEGGLTRSELERLHISIGVNHSMVEDPALYMALGINAFWLIVPKLIMSIACVQLYRVIDYIMRRGGNDAGGKIIA